MYQRVEAVGAVGLEVAQGEGEGLDHAEDGDEGHEHGDAGGDALHLKLIGENRISENCFLEL